MEKVVLIIKSYHQNLKHRWQLIKQYHVKLLNEILSRNINHCALVTVQPVQGMIGNINAIITWEQDYP